MSPKVVSRWQHVVTNNCAAALHQNRRIESIRLMRGGMKWNTVSSLFGTKAVGDEIIPCVSPLHPRRQASLLRSHAGGLSVVATTECMLYAASEVSVILRQTVWPSTNPHLPYHHYPPPILAKPSQCFSYLPQFSISYLTGPLSAVLVLHSYLLPQSLISLHANLSW